MIQSAANPFVFALSNVSASKFQQQAASRLKQKPLLKSFAPKVEAREESF